MPTPPTPAPARSPSPITIRDVAKLAGVSLGSVSRVVNGKATVTEEVRKRVQAAIRELDYHPNVAAQSIRNNSSRMVGCIIRDINVSGLAAFVRAASATFFDAGYALLLATSEGEPERERAIVSLMAGRQVDALILCQHSERDPLLLKQLEQIKVPVVLVDREVPAAADAVLIDHRGCARRATETLLQLGHRRIALITGQDWLFPGRERIAGFVEAHIRHGVDHDPALVRSGSFLENFGFEQAHALLSLPTPPTAIIAGGVEMLPGVLRAARVLERVIPRDLSVVGSLNPDLTELFTPSISIENWDYAEVGRVAARFALERIKRCDEPPRRISVPTEFVMRDSCAPPPAN